MYTCIPVYIPNTHCIFKKKMLIFVREHGTLVNQLCVKKRENAITCNFIVQNIFLKK